MKASRLLSILMLLQVHGRLSAPELAQRLEVSARTIYRDVDELFAAGVPIHADRGKGGGLALEAGWQSDLTGLTVPEVEALALTAVPSAATQLGLGGPAASAQLKIIASLAPARRAQASDVASRLHIDPVDWYRTPELPPLLRELAAAVWRVRVVQVNYLSWSGLATRQLHPLGLVLKAGVWYLVARAAAQETIKTYRVSAIQSLVSSEQAFRRPRRFDLPSYWREATARFEAERFTVRAHLRLSPRAQVWLRNANTPFEPSKTASLSELDSGWQQAHVAMESIDHGVRTVLGWGMEVEVLGPPALRDALRDEVARLAARYGIDPAATAQ